MPRTATRNTDPLVTQVVRLSRLLQRLKSWPPGGTYDRSANVLLLVIHRLGPQRVADLATTCHVDASTVSRQAADLVREGLLRRESDPRDGRASLMALTSVGEDQVAHLIERRREFFEEVVADWDRKELESFLALLTRFVDDIELLIGVVDPVPAKVEV